MRKPRDFDSELKALADKAKALKGRRVRQLGELVIATGAGDAFDSETLAGALLAMTEVTEQPRKESWRKRGAAFFQGKTADRLGGVDHNKSGAATSDGRTVSA